MGPGAHVLQRGQPARELPGGLRPIGGVLGQTGEHEVVDAADVPLVAEWADMLQVGTRNMQNFALLQAVGSAGKPVMLKRGMTATYEEWLMAAEYVAQRGNLDIDNPGAAPQPQPQEDPPA